MASTTCPSCGKTIKWKGALQSSKKIRCPSCDKLLVPGNKKRDDRPGRSGGDAKKNQGNFPLYIALGAGGGVLALVGLFVLSCFICSGFSRRRPDLNEIVRVRDAKEGTSKKTALPDIKGLLATTRRDAEEKLVFANKVGQEGLIRGAESPIGKIAELQVLHAIKTGDEANLAEAQKTLDLLNSPYASETLFRTYFAIAQIGNADHASKWFGKADALIEESSAKKKPIIGGRIQLGTERLKYSLASDNKEFLALVENEVKREPGLRSALANYYAQAAVKYKDRARLDNARRIAEEIKGDAFGHQLVLLKVALAQARLGDHAAADQSFRAHAVSHDGTVPTILVMTACEAAVASKNATYLSLAEQYAAQVRSIPKARNGAYEALCKGQIRYGVVQKDATMLDKARQNAERAKSTGPAPDPYQSGLLMDIAAAYVKLGIRGKNQALVNKARQIVADIGQEYPTHVASARQSLNTLIACAEVQLAATTKDDAQIAKAISVAKKREGNPEAIYLALVEAGFTPEPSEILPPMNDRDARLNFNMSLLTSLMRRNGWLPHEET